MVNGERPRRRRGKRSEAHQTPSTRQLVVPRDSLHKQSLAHSKAPPPPPPPPFPPLLMADAVAASYQ